MVSGVDVGDPPSGSNQSQRQRVDQWWTLTRGMLECSSPQVSYAEYRVDSNLNKSYVGHMDKDVIPPPNGRLHPRSPLESSQGSPADPPTHPHPQPPCSTRTDTT